MRLNIFKYIITLCIVFFNLQVSNVLAAKEKIVLAADYWCPYNCNPEDENPGYLVELAKKIFSIYGIEVDYKLLPWSEALMLAEEGKVDGVIGLSEGDTRNLITTNIAQAKSIMSSYTALDTDWVYDGVDSLRGKRISIILDYNLTDVLRQYISANYPKNPDLFIIEEGRDAVMDSIDNLLKGKADLYIEDELVVNYCLVKNNLLHKIRNVGRVENNPLPVYIAFSKKIKKSREYIKMLEEGMRSITATGDVADLKKKYKITP